MNIRKFCKEHKKEIVVAGCIVGAAIVGGVATKIGLAKHYRTFIDLKGKDAITWPAGYDGFINLERVKEILDLNANNSEPFAIFREGADPNAYICIALSDNVAY